MALTWRLGHSNDRTHRCNIGLCARKHHQRKRHIRQVTPQQLFYGYNRALDLAEAHAIAVSLTPAANAERIAVFEERTALATINLKRHGPVPAQLQHAAALGLFGAADGA